MSNYEKYRQVRREAGWTGILLAALIVFWCLAGFGLADVEMEIFGLPLWAVMGTIGVWLFAIIGVKLLTEFIFQDMSLDDDDQREGADK